MPNKSRGVTLTIFALLFLLMAISNFGKPFSHQAGVGFVFHCGHFSITLDSLGLVGTRLSGVPNMIIAPIFGIILAMYAHFGTPHFRKPHSLNWLSSRLIPHGLA